MTRIRLIAALGIGTAFAALAAAPAIAQNNPPPGAPGTDEQQAAAANQAQQAEDPSGSDAGIVVTARRRAETLLNVPIAVTAFTGAQLENQGARDITEIADTTPNVTLEVS